MVLPTSNPTKSYWIEAAKSPLRDYRSTEDLPAEVDVVVVGAGYSGAATAYWIHKVCGSRTTSRLRCGRADRYCSTRSGQPFSHKWPSWKPEMSVDVPRDVMVSSL